MRHHKVLFLVMMQDGRIKVGDQIISVDNVTLEGCTQEE